MRREVGGNPDGSESPMRRKGSRGKKQEANAPRGVSKTPVAVLNPPPGLRTRWTRRDKDVHDVQ